jgi:uncharacterized protein (TIGR02594 family)
MTIDCSVPRHLMVMRSLNGMTETPGSANNPKIMAMRDWIACTYGDMKSYCELYTGDDVAWCGLTAAFCMTVAGVRPPFGKTDTDKFLWALSWADDEGYEFLDKPILGCIVVLSRSGGGHVTFYESTSGSNYMCRGGNQSDQVNLAPQAISNVVALVWPQGVPKPVPGPTPPLPGPTPGHKTVQKGSEGPDVIALQTSLGVLIPDGDFGSITDTWVKAFQASCGLGTDGVVGDATWKQVDALDVRVKTGVPPLPQTLVDQIYTMAQESEIADYSWPDRGVMPPGYIAGMALSFAYAARMDGDARDVMEKAQGNPDKDALAWYEPQFTKLGMSNKTAGIATMRHLFVMMIGLGPRESSGKYCEGRDMSASNVASDTCEAGLFQTSWNIRSGSSAIGPLLPEFWDNPNGFLSQFKEGISPTSNNLNSYGSGDGVKYQWLSRFCPLFHVMVTGVGMRVLRQHWGPINKQAVIIKKEADDLLQSVQELIVGVA